MCADVEVKRLEKIKALYPSLETTTDYKEILRRPDIDAVCIASPTSTHFALAKEALEHHKHVLCEKPLALSAQECLTLKKLADQQKKVLMVGHVFLFNAGISWIKQCLDSGELGQIYYAYATRTNLGPFRYDVNALWDLAPHDISIFNYLFGHCPLSASAHGQKCLNTSLEDLVFINLEYPQNIIAHIHVSWLDPKKVRQMTIVGEKKMVVWDDLDNVGPVKLYDKHVEKTATFYATYGEFQLLTREGSITIPKVSMEEPLKVQGQYFLDCIKGKSTSRLADAQKALDVVQTLSAIQSSMDHNGSRVAIGNPE